VAKGQSSASEADPRDQAGDGRFDLTVTNMARVYDYWLGGDFLNS
jgi:hypothetical protein